MHYKHLITDEEATSQYRQLVKSIKEATYREKAAMLRTQFDILLHLCVERHIGRELKRNEVQGFEGLIDTLFPKNGDPALEGMRTRLHELRKTFNHLSAHTYLQFKREQSGKRVRKYGQHEYEFSMDVLSELIAFVSGSPIPASVNSAKKELKRIGIANKNRLDIILMMELFTSIDEIEDGSVLVRNYKEMLSQMKELGLENVQFHLVTYCRPICTDDSISNESLFSIPFNEALYESLNKLYDALDLIEAYNCERPWLVMLCHGVSNDADKGLIQELKDLYIKRTIDFMPVALNKESMDQINTIWPHSKPYRITSSVSSNFYKELIAAIQQQQLSKDKKSI